MGLSLKESERTVCLLTQTHVKSRRRVADHGEVLTGQREVNAMLDLVSQETERIESRFLEPACGTGNFLAEILRRKLQVVAARYSRSHLEYQRYAVLAVSSVYGIDILEDNVEECRERLYSVFDSEYRRLFKAKGSEGCREAVRFILSRNIVRGDALTLRTVGPSPEPIVFSEWSFVTGSMMKRRDFSFRSLIEGGKSGRSLLTQAQAEVSDLGKDVFIPNPEREFPLVHFLEVARVDD